MKMQNVSNTVNQVVLKESIEKLQPPVADTRSPQGYMGHSPEETIY